MTQIRKMDVHVEGSSETPTRMTINSGAFSLIIDEPQRLGGTDLGPSPIQVLLMSLAGCLNVTGHQVARQKGYTLNGMKISIDGVLNPCTFIGCSYEERAGFQKIQVSVEADMDGATPEQIDEWLQETEQRCPVTDNIKMDTPITVTRA